MRALLTVVAGHSNLDQPVRGERAIGFGNHRVGQSGVADDHDGLQRVGSRLQPLALGGRQRGSGLRGVHAALYRAGPARRR
ncbi:MAG TPA: hypothetical protein VM491_02970 [Burkholderiaceae bacterium]|nr:hypothetical protein [Burkholderiaceae bacterium]